MRRLLVLLLLLSPVRAGAGLGLGLGCQGGAGSAPRAPPVPPSPVTLETHTPAAPSPRSRCLRSCARPVPLPAPTLPRLRFPTGPPRGRGTPVRPPPCQGTPVRPPPCQGTPVRPPPCQGTPPAPPPGATIPLYCALLAAVVVGLVAYVAFKCWDTCRKKRQLDKARDAAESGMSPEGEKLRGDSGVFLDTPGPQEPPQHAPPEGPALLQVCPRREELERLLEPGGPGGSGGSGGSGPAGTPGDVTSAV
ncbi:tumor necrosis factor receptor superfamily member 16-like [Pithys albifrons albifrons]|uniref:tumor necrosis factor receptor superfamily member 16-like n=1 Tax=Pithys albifrons albifrons TaxID=3385563 RepID=UPI003A5D0EDF